MKQEWGWMLANGLKTCAEFFSLDYSLCHAWSANPTWYLSKNIPSLHFPKTPDMNEVEIRVTLTALLLLKKLFCTREV